MADIQNTRRKGLETWENAYKAVGKTKEEIQDLNSEFADFVANLNEFSDGTEVRFLDFLDNLDDVSKHWKEINEWIDQNSTKLDQFTGSLSNVRDIFKSITELVGGNRRQIADGYSIARRLENLAADSVSILDREGGLTERTVTNQIKKSQILRDQFRVRTESLAPEVDFNRLSQQDLDILRKKQNIQERLQKEAIKHLEFLQENRGDRKEIRALEEEIKLRQLNIEYLDIENIKAVKGLAKQLEYRKELWRQQRAGGVAAGENSQSIIPVNIAAKLLQKAGLVDQSSDLKDNYNEWVTRRIDAIEKVKQAQEALTEAEKQAEVTRKNAINRARRLGRVYKEDLEKLREKAKELGIDIDKPYNLNRLTEAQKAVLRSYDEIAAKKANLEQSTKSKVSGANKAVQEATDFRDKVEANRVSVFADKFNFPKIIESLGGIKSILTAIAGILAVAIFRQLLKFDDEAVKTKRVIGQWADASALANTKFVTGTEVLKTMRELGEQFHINPVQVFSSEELGRIAQAQKLTGMTSQAAGNLAVQSKITGKNADTYRDSIAKGANQANRLNHSAVNLSAVQNDVLNTSRAIALSYGKNTEGLARAAGAAAALGMNLQDVENISKNLMNFESSIEAEMQAQLLTGMQLNLAKAREYALNNNLEGVASEIGRQGMNAAKFSHMNYIQQENMAKALGMSREQMSKMLIMQEINRGLTAKQVAAMTGMRKEDIEALSAQEKWQTMKQKFLEALVPLLEPILQLTTDILIPVTRFVLGPVTWLAGLISRIGGLVRENNVFVRGLVGLLAIGIPAALLRGIGLVGILKKGFSGIAGLTKGIATHIGGWATKLKGASTASQATQSIFDKTANRWRDVKSGRFVKAPEEKEGFLSRIFGRTKDVPTPEPKAAESASKFGNTFSSLGENMGNILKGAAAAALIAGAVFVLAKAAQEFMKVSWGSIGKAVVGMLTLVGAVALLGAVMSSGVGAVAVLAGAAAMVVMAGAVGLLGLALKQFENINWETLGKLPVAMLSLASAGALALIAGPSLALGAPMLLMGSLALLAATVPLRAALQNLTIVKGDELGSFAEGINLTAVAVGNLAGSLRGLNLAKFTALTAINTLGNLGNAVASRIARPQSDEIITTEKSGESKEIKRENIEAAVQTITIKQAQVQASAQQISVEQKAADLSKIEQKMDRLEKAINSLPRIMDWNEFNRAQRANG